MSSSRVHFTLETVKAALNSGRPASKICSGDAGRHHRSVLGDRRNALHALYRDFGTITPGKVHADNAATARRRGTVGWTAITGRSS